ncbi:MAG: DUF3987 domain-containing protein, partial [Steroidobacteraceae bacterium]
MSADPVAQFRAAIERAGLAVPEHVIADGTLHRFATNGANIANASTLSDACVKPNRRDAMLDAAERAAAIWIAAQPVTEHPHLQRKGVGAHGIRIDGDRLTPLPEGLPPVEPFDGELLPPLLRRYVSDITERMQCPPDFPAVALMTVLSSMIGRRCALRPKRLDDRTVVPNLWGIVIGRPGLMKSPPMQEVMQPLQVLQARCDGRVSSREPPLRQNRKPRLSGAFAFCARAASLDRE